MILSVASLICVDDAARIYKCTRNEHMNSTTSNSSIFIVASAKRVVMTGMQGSWPERSGLWSPKTLRSLIHPPPPIQNNPQPKSRIFCIHIKKEPIQIAIKTPHLSQPPQNQPNYDYFLATQDNSHHNKD